ncbi:hypothetical protein B0H63DRAFT_518538 [Podospora didyma]|uniref:Uncharacterized protein n=1 Tax=Podospora didyma TaxID=330526 RepID=A0AAE0NX90_9PEZI|nr:hypothetical protein B0H63DRAFT_518538 [Podospora didyma]
MASNVEEDLIPEETGYKVTQPKQSLAEYQNMGSFSTILTACLPVWASKCSVDRLDAYLPPA